MTTVWEARPSPVVTLLPDIVTKKFPEQIRHRYDNEVAAYRTVPWAAPALLCADSGGLAIERCTPVLEVPPDPDHARQLRELLLRVHAAGWAHRDVSVANVVLHPTRGVLLIDWETSGPAGPASYDLHGATAAGYPQEELPPHQRPDGVWWGRQDPHAPGVYWKEQGADL